MGKWETLMLHEVNNGGLMASRSKQGEDTTRPHLSMGIEVKDLHDYYWLKDELVAFCVRYSLPSGGRKLEILDRIEMFLKTGRVMQPKPALLGAKRDSGTS